MLALNDPVDVVYTPHQIAAAIFSNCIFYPHRYHAFPSPLEYLYINKYTDTRIRTENFLPYYQRTNVGIASPDGSELCWSQHTG